MQYKFNVKDKRDLKKIEFSKRFIKYPDMFLSETCLVRVNKDDFLKEDEFTIQSKLKILPRKICVYGKKTKISEENDLFLNYWINIFFKTVENGNLCKYDFSKCNSKLEMCIGLPYEYRCNAFLGRKWDRNNIINFLSCLFDNELEEADFEQQDFWEELMVA